MATKQLPLRSYGNIIKTPIHVVDKYNYACWVVNKGSKDGTYDYSGDKFSIHILTGTGYVDGDKKWFLATVPDDENQKAFKFEIKPSWQQPVDKAISEEAEKLWKATGNLIAIDCSNLPALACLVEVLHETKQLIKGALNIKINIDDAAKASLKNEIPKILDFYKEHKRLPQSKRGEDVKGVTIVNESLGIPYPLFDEPNFGLPQADEVDEITGLPTGEKTSQSVPFEGRFEDEIIRFIFSPPDMPEPYKGGGNSRGGSSVTVESYTAEKGWDFFLKKHDDISEFLRTRYTMDGHNQLMVILSLCGVQDVPLLQGIDENASPKQPSNLTHTSNGQTGGTIIGEAIKSSSNGKHLETVMPERPKVEEPEKINSFDALKERLNELMIKDKKTGGLGLNKDQAASWFKLHEGTPEDISNLLYIIQSQSWVNHRKQMSEFYTEKGLGFASADMPPTVCSSELLKEVAEMCHEVFEKSQIEPQASWLMFSL